MTINENNNFSEEANKSIENIVRFFSRLDKKASEIALLIAEFDKDVRLMMIRKAYESGDVEIGNRIEKANNYLTALGDLDDMKKNRIQ